ncbi:hypothetical protein ACLOJK_037251, partial [Asimina triloba]
ALSESLWSYITYFKRKAYKGIGQYELNREFDLRPPRVNYELHDVIFYHISTKKMEKRHAKKDHLLIKTYTREVLHFDTPRKCHKQGAPLTFMDDNDRNVRYLHDNPLFEIEPKNNQVNPSSEEEVIIKTVKAIRKELKTRMNKNVVG